MHYAGVLPEDAPDPRLKYAEMLRDMPVAVMGLVPQPSIEDANVVGMNSSMDATGYSAMTASVAYTLWRNPLDHSDPINLAEFDEATRRSLEEVPPWPRPAWLVELVERMRYAHLWEAVHTTWHREASGLPSPSRLLTNHANYVLVNRFRRELGLGDIGSERYRPHLAEKSVNPRATVIVDGVERPAVEIDTDPYVYAIGCELAGGGVMTAVLPRDDLQYLRVEFAQRGEPQG